MIFPDTHPGCRGAVSMPTKVVRIADPAGAALVSAIANKPQYSIITVTT
jgi:hypothetical protein